MSKLSLERLRVRSLDTDSNEVTWEITDTVLDVLDFSFYVLRSESPEGPFDTVAGPFEDRYIFVDRRIPAGDKFRQIWYRIRWVHKASGETTDSESVTREAEPDLIASYIRRMEMTLWTQVNGRLIWLFKRRTFGTRCPSCWDPVTGRKTKSNCLSCYQTGFLRGYHNPIEVWMQIDPPAKAQQNGLELPTQLVVTTGRTSFYPNIVPGDVVVEAENKRWRVDRVTQTERLRAPVKQEPTMIQINDTDIEFKLPLRVDQALKDIQPSPPRMFTNPTDLNDAVDTRVPDVFANYPTYPLHPED